MSWRLFLLNRKETKKPHCYQCGFTYSVILLCLISAHQSFGHFNHFLDAIFRQVSFFEFCQDLRIFVLHFQQEMFFKFLHISSQAPRSINPVYQGK